VVCHDRAAGDQALTSVWGSGPSSIHRPR
jgi:hypothetical protein